MNMAPVDGPLSLIERLPVWRALFACVALTTITRLARAALTTPSAAGSGSLSTPSSAPAPFSAPTPWAAPSACASAGSAQWRLDHDGPLLVGGRLEWPGCNTSAFTLSAVRSCFSGRHLLFIGDSVTRFQYLSLAHFLHTGAWDSGSPPLEEEKPWGSWKSFLEGATLRLQPNSYVPSNPLSPSIAARELCDCWRDGLMDNVAVPGYPHLALSSIENRFYTNLEHGLRLSWLQFFGAHNLAGHSLEWLSSPNCSSLSLAARGRAREGSKRVPAQSAAAAPNASVAACAQRGCVPGACAGGHFVHTWSEMIRNRTRAGGPLEPIDGIVINSGIWKSMEDSREELLAAIGTGAEENASLAVRTGAVWWKTTTPQAPTAPWPGFTEFEPNVEAAFRARGWGVLDVRSAANVLRSLVANGSETEASIFTPDSWHYRAWVYRAFNEILIGQLCQRESPWLA